MDIEEDNEYLVELEKLMTSEVAATLWANNMDLLALITFDNLIQLYRISYKAQLVFQVSNDKVIKGLAFSPDCITLFTQLNTWRSAWMTGQSVSSRHKMEKKSLI